MEERVCGLVAGGAHAEYLVTHERAVALVPDGLSWEIAGAAPEAYITAHDALVGDQAGLRPGELVLVHAVGSGVGLAAVQLATELGATVFGTARGIGKLEVATAMGMRAGCQPGGEGWVGKAVAGWTDGRGVNVVIDLVGGDYTPESLGAMAPKGRLMLIGSLAGTEATLDLRLILGKRLTIRGTVLRSRPLEERIAVIQAFEREVLPWLASGRLAPRIDASSSWRQSPKRTPGGGKRYDRQGCARDRLRGVPLWVAGGYVVRLVRARRRLRGTTVAPIRGDLHSPPPASATRGGRF